MAAGQGQVSDAPYLPCNTGISARSGVEVTVVEGAQAETPSSHARDRCALATAPAARHIPQSTMAGSQLKRAHTQGARLDDGRIIAFPYLPRVADLPSGRRHFSAAEKIEHLIGLDRCYEILSWPSAGLDRARLSMKAQVVHIILIIAGKALLNGKPDREVARERERGQALARLMSELP